MNNIRNFSVIAHIDHGKSTLADRMLETTHTIEKRKMREQVLDSMELERERGITIKMRPVRMNYTHEGKDYILNLIDTPGHIDFSYEVSRALKAVEGSILLVDSTQGVQAQTLTTLGMARENGLVIIPVITKIDSPLARVEDVKDEVVSLLGCDRSDILEVSGKTGEGVENLLSEVIKRVPAPKEEVSATRFRSLVFDFNYSTHKGVVVYIRVMSGSVSKNMPLDFKISEKKFVPMEVGVFNPDEVAVDSLKAGEIGYIITGIKESEIASVGDTIADVRDELPALSGYMSPRPVVWASIFPESQDDFIILKQSVGRLKLSDSSFSFEEESSGSLGRGYRCGFLGMLHLEIITERLKREFGLNLVVTTPSIIYEIELKNNKKMICYSPSTFPNENDIVSVREPWVSAKIIAPSTYLGALMTLFYEHEAEVGDSEIFGDSRTSVTVHMPLRELMRGFFDKIKSITSGYGSISYEMAEMRDANVTRLDVFVADEPVQAFARVVAKRSVEVEAEKAVEKLHSVLPKQMFTTKIQGVALGRIIASRTLTAMKKDVTGYLYGGDRTRKMKLWAKQKEGKKKMKEIGKVNIPHEVFLKMMKTED